MHGEHDATPDPLYLPASHGRHDVALGDENVPDEHELHPEAPEALILPPSQALQSSMESWKLARFPLSLRNLPLGQAPQLADPLYGAIWPLPQIEHEVAPASEYVPGEHAAHTCPSKYEPARHNAVIDRLKYVV